MTAIYVNYKISGETVHRMQTELTLFAYYI